MSCNETVNVFVFIVHTLAELKMTGNCLKGSRPLLSFDPVSETHLWISCVMKITVMIVMIVMMMIVT